MLKRFAVMLLVVVSIVAMISVAADDHRGPKTIATGEDVSFPESIVVADGVAYVSNFFDGAIYAVNMENGETSVLVEAGEDGVVAGWGLTLEEGTGLLIACGNRNFTPGPQENINSARAVDLESGEIVESWELPEGRSCNSIDLDSAGNIFISDVSSNASILRIERETGEVSVWADEAAWENESGFGLGGMIVDENDTVFVSAQGPLLSIAIEEDGTAGDIVPITLLDAEGNELPGLGFDGFAYAGEGVMYGAAFDFESGKSMVVKVSVVDETTAETEVIFDEGIGITGIWADQRHVYAVDGQILQGLSVPEYEPVTPFVIYAMHSEDK